MKHSLIFFVSLLLGFPALGWALDPPQTLSPQLESLPGRPRQPVSQRPVHNSPYSAPRPQYRSAPSRSPGNAPPMSASVNVTGGDNLLIILDASYSMLERLSDGQSKISVAKRVILDTLKQVPPATRVGLRIYGYSANPLTSCSASRLFVPLGVGNRNLIASELVGIRPTGETPISLSLQKAIQQDFVGVSGKKTILLVTDGMETCDADPCRVAVQLIRNGSDVKINTVALGLGRDFNALKQLKCIASATYGKFYNTNTAAEFSQGLRDAMSAQTHVEAEILPSH